MGAIKKEINELRAEVCKALGELTIVQGTLSDDVSRTGKAAHHHGDEFLKRAYIRSVSTFVKGDEGFGESFIRIAFLRSTI
jgi:hypothetical protein